MNWKTLGLCGASAMAMATGTAATAQETASTAAPEAAARVESFNANEIIVSARRREESVQDVPLVVNAVSADALARNNVREFKDVAILVPGLSLTNANNGIGSQATLRGVAYDVNASGANGTIEFYQNDAPIPASVVFQSMFDVGQIEVLRGPQGTLRGRASPSGSITITTHRPDLSEAGGYVEGTLTNFGDWNLNGAINVPVIPDRLAVRAAGVWAADEESRVTSIHNPLDPYRKTYGGRLSVLAEPVDWLTLFGSYTRTDRQARTYDQVESLNVRDPSAPASPVLIHASDREAVLNVPRTYRQRYTIWNWQAQVRFADQKLDYVGSHTKLYNNSFEPADKGAVFSQAFPYSFQNVGLDTITDSWQETHEVRVSNEARVLGMFDYVAGILFNETKAPTYLTTTTPIFARAPIAPQNVFVLNGTPFVAVTPSTRVSANQERSIFGNVTAHLGEDTELSGGIRFIHFRSTGSLVSGGVRIAAADEDSTRTARIYQGTIKHRLKDDMMVYASFGTSWRPGSSTNAIILRDVLNPGPALRSLYFPGDETSQSYEIGIKSEWLDKRLKLNVSAFHQDFKNFAYNSRNPIVAGQSPTSAQFLFTNLTGITVGVPVKVDGVEAEIAFQPAPQWDIGLTAAYSISKIKNAPIPCNDYNPQDGIPDTNSSVPTYAQVYNGGQQVAICNVNFRAGISPPFTATLQSEFRQPVGSLGEGYVRGLVNYSGNSQNDPSNAFDDVKAYALVNLYAGLRSADGGWELGAYVKNLFDVYRATSVQAKALSVGTAGAGTGVSTYRAVSSLDDREFGVNLRVLFGSR